MNIIKWFKDLSHRIDVVGSLVLQISKAQDLQFDILIANQQSLANELNLDLHFGTLISNEENKE